MTEKELAAEKEKAYQEGYDAAANNADATNPYSADTQGDLHEAWKEGNDEAWKDMEEEDEESEED